MLPAQLRKAGYRTHMIGTRPRLHLGCTSAACGFDLTSYLHAGKWHQGLSSPLCLPINRGFETSFGYLSGAEDHMDQTVQGKL